VIDNIEKILKNGRLGKITGRLINYINIKLIMGSDGAGNIARYGVARGHRQIIEKLLDTIAKSGRKTDGESIVITHCNNPTLAEKLMRAIEGRYRFREISVVPTSGLSSVYANVGGVIMAF
jgi:fatty acid-binding protein DegV